MQENESALPPAVLFRSFLLISSAYILNIMVVGLVALALLIVFFPESYEVIIGDQQKFETIFKANPEKVYPAEFLWAVLVVSCAVCFGFGYSIARLSPIAKFPHAIFFSAIQFIQYLHLAIGATDSLQRMFVLFMGAAPVAAILGANFYLTRTNEEKAE